MKKPIAIFIIALLLTGCATRPGYYESRDMDFGVNYKALWEATLETLAEEGEEARIRNKRDRVIITDRFKVDKKRLMQIAEAICIPFLS